MQTVVETNAFITAAKVTGMDEETRSKVVDIVAADPEAGILCRDAAALELRIARQGKGKSGGYRVITYFGGVDMPVFLLTVFGKNEKANLTRAERNQLAVLTKRLRSSF